MSDRQNPTVDATEEPWNPDEFVVALRHLPVVLDELRNLPLPVGRPGVRESDALDLALVTIPEVDKIAAQIPLDLPPGAGKYPIDRVMRTIRDSCRSKYGYWTPLIGKNRMLNGVHTVQHVGTGSARSYPKPASRTSVGSLVANATLERPVVGVVDTPLWPHPDLDGRYRKGESDVMLDPATFHWHPAGHATFVTAVVLQNSPNIDVIVRRGLGAGGTALTWEVAEEMVKLARSVDVLNVSFACFTDDDKEPLLLARAVEMVGPDKVIVAAAGNFADCDPGDGRYAPRSPMSPMWPAASSRVVAVGAHDAAGGRAAFSPDAPWVDMTARGVDVASLYLEGPVKFRTYENGEERESGSFDGCATWTGTSFAAAMVSGAIARRIRRGSYEVDARRALEQVRRLPTGNSEQVWHRPFVSRP